MSKIGILTGMDDTFPRAFIEQVHLYSGGEVSAELISLGGTKLAEACSYSVILDRLSHQVRYYRTYLKNAALSGVRIINNPFWRDADDRFLQNSMAVRLGVMVPRTMVLPQHDLPEGIAPQDLRNLIYPLNWSDIAGYVGFPAILKPCVGSSWRRLHKVHSLDEMIAVYNRTGDVCMVLQEFIEFDHYVRCLCIGRDFFLPIRYDPYHRQYIVDHEHLSAETAEHLVQSAKKLHEAFGYDVNCIEFAIRDGIPIAIDFLNPAPDFSLYSLTRHYFEIVVDRMARLAIRCARNPLEDTHPVLWKSLLQG